MRLLPWYHLNGLMRQCVRSAAPAGTVNASGQPVNPAQEELTHSALQSALRPVMVPPDVRQRFGVIKRQAVWE
jgi:hypothetical protein